ncbi:MAG: radical SAM protein [Nannocystaceae bacterium]
MADRDLPPTTVASALSPTARDNRILQARTARARQIEATHAWDGDNYRLEFELTRGCDHACAHCYNVWGADAEEPQAQYATSRQRDDACENPASQTLRPDAHLALIEETIRARRPHTVVLTGGEPMLHPRGVEIVSRVAAQVPSVGLITNGSHGTDALVETLATAGNVWVQLTLLAPDPDTHDRLKGAVSFDDTVRALVRLADAGVATQVCFVSMQGNEGLFPQVMELALALGARHVNYNRVAPTGVAVRSVAGLLPQIDAVREDLRFAETHGPGWGISVTTAIPIPPCVRGDLQLEWVQMGGCPVGTHVQSTTIDPSGNVRSCPLSSHVLGNLQCDTWEDIEDDPYPRAFRQLLPELCRTCEHAPTCHGGCKESAFATSGTHLQLDPFVAAALGHEVREPGGALIPLARLRQRGPRTSATATSST